MTEASHVKIITGVEETSGSTLLGRYVILYNSNRVTRKQVSRIVSKGEHSPYVLMLPEDQFYGLFRDTSPEERAEKAIQRDRVLDYFFDEEGLSTGSTHDNTDCERTKGILPTLRRLAQQREKER